MTAQPVRSVVADGKELVVEFRVTIGLGQDSVDPDVLHTRAATVHQHLAGDLSGAAVAAVAVDPVKATVQLVVTVDAEDALTAAQRALAVTGRALHGAGLAAPVTILTAEAEAVPDPAAASAARSVFPHPLPEPPPGAAGVDRAAA